MSLPLSAMDIAGAAAWCVGGVVFSLVYFEALRRTVRMFGAADGWYRPVAYTLARIALAGGLLVVAALQGALPLLAAFLGFLIGRSIALRRARRTG